MAERYSPDWWAMEYETLNECLRQAERERDEARAVARQMANESETDYNWTVPEAMWEQYPWLKESEPNGS